ncbi:MAG: ATP-binding protein, partial [Clostridiaceae bacterium]|nr:ATP-binding protein [Clostridiaceae bacterium]
MFQQEQYNLELKESVTKTFLKTVCAYANYHNGRIVFGITDSGDVVGVSPVREEMLRIENQINDSIDPRPAYNLSIESRGKKRIVVLDV